jgi:hypothetical protein
MQRTTIISDVEESEKVGKKEGKKEGTSKKWLVQR